MLSLSALFGIFIHPFIAFALTIPILVISIYIVFFQTEPYQPSATTLQRWFAVKLKDRVFLHGFLPAFICAALLIATWYLTAGSQLLGTLQSIDSQSLADFRGYAVFTKGLKNNAVPYFLWYLLTTPNAISNVLTLFFGIGVIHALISRKPYYITLTVAFFGAYLLFAAQSTMTWMHFAEVLPVVSVLSVSWIGGIGRKWVRYSLVALLFAVSLFVYWIVMWGFGSAWEKPVASTLSAPLSSSGLCLSGDQVFCPRPPITENWKPQIEELIATVLNDPDCSAKKCNIMISQYGPQFQVTVFSYYLTIDHPANPITLSALRDNAWSPIPFDFRRLISNRYTMYVDDNVKGKTYNAALQRFLHSPPASFSRSHILLRSLRLPGGHEARLIKRLSPVTLQETQDVIRSIDVPEKYKSQQYELLAPLYLEAGQYDKALAAYRQALLHGPGADAELYFGLASAYAVVRSEG